jgi:hypothetical protein
LQGTSKRYWGKRVKRTKIIAIADVSGLPVSTHVDCASSHEVMLVEDRSNFQYTKTFLMKKKNMVKELEKASLESQLAEREKQQTDT